MKSHWLECEISPGQFSGEYVVQAKDYQNNGFSLFVPDNVVDFDSDPNTAGRTVNGWVQVEVLDQNDKLSLVKLPRAPLENGPTVTVRRDQLSFRHGRELA